MNSQWNKLRQEAENPRTSARRLAELAQLEPSLWELIVRNPQCDPSYREWILSQRPDLVAQWTDEAPRRATVPPSLLKATPSTDVSARSPRRRRRGAMVAVAMCALLLGLVAAGGGAYWGYKSFSPAPAAADEEQRRPRRDEIPSHRTESTDADGADAATEPATDAPTDAATGTATDGPANAATHVPADEDDGPEDALPESDRPGDAAPTEPVPADDDYVLISSPSQNISCELRGGLAGCSIADRPADTECEDGDRVASYLIYDGAYPTRMCDAVYLGAPGDPVTTLDYGESITVQGTTCTSEATGMTCRDEDTGHGMTLSRSAVTLF